MTPHLKNVIAFAKTLGFDYVWAKTLENQGLWQATKKSKFFSSSGLYIKWEVAALYIGKTSNLGKRIEKYLARNETCDALFFLECPSSELDRLEEKVIAIAKEQNVELTNNQLNYSKGNLTPLPDIEVLIPRSSLKAHLERARRGDVLFEVKMQEVINRSRASEFKAYMAFCEEVPNSKFALWAVAQLMSIATPEIFSLAPHYWSVFVMPAHKDNDKREILGLTYGALRTITVLGIKQKMQFGLKLLINTDPKYVNETLARKFNVKFSVESNVARATFEISLEKINELMAYPDFRVALASFAINALTKRGASNITHNEIVAYALYNLAPRFL